MPSSSKREILMDYLIDTLFPTITTGNGYNFTVSTKELGLRGKTSMGDHEFPALFVASADEDCENLTNKDFKSLMNVVVVGMVKQRTDDQKIQKELSKLIRDLRVAIYTDPTQGGRCLWSDVKTILTDQGDNKSHAEFSALIVFTYKSAGIAP